MARTLQYNTYHDIDIKKTNIMMYGCIDFLTQPCHYCSITYNHYDVIKRCPKNIIESRLGWQKRLDLTDSP